MIEEFCDTLPLYGESYNLWKKLLMYSVVGNAVKHNLIFIGDNVLDTRINFALPAKAGAGKSTVKTWLKTILTKMGRQLTEPVSLHPEQLVGKTVISETGEVFVNRGHLADDFVIFDEAIELLTHKELQIARDYVNIALDPIGTNEVYKRQVDIPKASAVRYFPTCTIGFFFHPVPLPETVISRGLLRRLFMAYIEPTEVERLRALGAYNNCNSAKLQMLVERLKELANTQIVWNVKPLGTVISKTKQLIAEGYSFSQKIAEFTDIMWFTLRDRLIKLAAVRGVCKNAGGSIEEIDVIRAYNDLREFFLSQCYFVDNYINISYQTYNRHVKIKTILNTIINAGSVIDVNTLASAVAQKLQLSVGSVKSFIYSLAKGGVLGIDETGRVTLSSIDDEIARKLLLG